MKKIFIGVMVIIVCLHAVVYEKSGNTIVIYSSMEQFRNDALRKQLDQKFPEYDIRLMYMPSGKVAAKVKSEKTNTDADIIIGLDQAFLEMIKESLGNALPRTKLDYLPGLNPKDGKYVIWESVGGGFAVNTHILEKYGLPEPKTYDDLLDPRYEGLIATQDPKSSVTGYDFYLAMRNEKGMEKTLEYYDKLNANIKQYCESGSGPVKLLIQGEIAVATALTYIAVSEINNGHPLKMIYPPEGSPFSLSGTSFIKGREQDPRIMEVFDYIINDFLVYDKVWFNPGKILKEQYTEIPNYPENIQYADMTGIENRELKSEMLKLWKY